VEGDTQSFVVRIWREEVDEDGNITAWRGSVDHVGSGGRVHFQDLDQLTGFIRRRAGLSDSRVGRMGHCVSAIVAWIRRRLAHPRRRGLSS